MFEFGIGEQDLFVQPAESILDLVRMTQGAHSILSLPHKNRHCQSTISNGDDDLMDGEILDLYSRPRYNCSEYELKRPILRLCHPVPWTESRRGSF